MLKLYKLFKWNFNIFHFRRKKAYRICAVITSISVVAAMELTVATDAIGYSLVDTTSCAFVEDDERSFLAEAESDYIVLTATDTAAEEEVILTSTESSSEKTTETETTEKTTETTTKKDTTGTKTTEAETTKATVEESGSAATVSSSAVQNSLGLEISEADYDALLRIVQAEAGNQSEKGKIMVANVILNRVNDSRFPDTIYEVIYQNSGGVYQFSPTASADFENVTASESTITCVERALAGEDYSQGALYFTSYYEDTSWFNTSLTFIVQEGAHYFYK